MKKFRIVTQTDSIEQGKAGTTADNWMDDCAPSSLAAAVNWLVGSSYTSKDGIAWVAKAGRRDRDGFGDPTSFEQITRAAKALDLRLRWAKSWSEVLEALGREDRALLISVDQPKNYPASVRLSKWARAHKKRTGGKSYGHLTAAVGGGTKGVQWADPTMSGRGDEEFAVEITFTELRQILASRFPGAEYKGVRILSVAQPTPPPAPAAPTPVVPAISVRERIEALRNRIRTLRRGLK